MNSTHAQTERRGLFGEKMNEK